MKRQTSQATSREGINYVRTIVERNNCTFQEIPVQDDLGNDAYIEFIRGEDSTGCCIALQVKSGSSYIRSRKKSFSVQLSKEHFEYWASHTLPICIIVFDPKNATAYWADVTDYLVSNGNIIKKGPYSITLNKSNVFDNENFISFIDYYISEREKYTNLRNFGKSLESFSNTGSIDLCWDGLKSLFSFHRDKDATWYYLISTLDNFRGSVLLPNLIYYLSLLPGHMDIYWSDKNIIEENIRMRAQALLYKSLNEERVVTLLGAVGDSGFERGSIGQAIFTIIFIIWPEDRAKILSSIAYNQKIDTEIRNNAFYLYIYDSQDSEIEDIFIEIEQYCQNHPDNGLEEIWELMGNHLAKDGYLDIF
ncbi:DUF4365 domain-containing protein [Deinococcus sp. SM5_A1]|uniref:DUF4365 domain-containing protein n=1 Tax=Deinococcus sp. SM5_A1 TaxID=3379094 RepID=UPI003858E21D